MGGGDPRAEGASKRSKSSDCPQWGIPTLCLGRQVQMVYREQLRGSDDSKLGNLRAFSGLLRFVHQPVSPRGSRTTVNSHAPPNRRPEVAPTAHRAPARGASPGSACRRLPVRGWTSVEDGPESAGESAAPDRLPAPRARREGWGFQILMANMLYWSDSTAASAARAPPAQAAPATAAHRSRRRRRAQRPARVRRQNTRRTEAG